ncbi:MAG: sulfur relay protein DsrC [Gammaproteobacteria bacterium]|nr:sulfur relay protein DsrC [Gammaproteobacteria bacterium]|tara:strand:+ start:71920 stop:72111 length:192 start_codon:yes stop_codon:yes gene_type:complete
MLYLSSLLIEYKEVETFDELIEVVKEKAKLGEIFIKMDLKPPYPDTPDDWEEKIESAFSGYQK